MDIWDNRCLVQPFYSDPSQSGHVDSYRRCCRASVGRFRALFKRTEKPDGGVLASALVATYNNLDDDSAFTLENARNENDIQRGHQCSVIQYSWGIRHEKGNKVNGTRAD